MDLPRVGGAVRSADPVDHGDHELSGRTHLGHLVDLAHRVGELAPGGVEPLAATTICAALALGITKSQEAVRPARPANRLRVSWGCELLCGECVLVYVGVFYWVL